MQCDNTVRPLEMVLSEQAQCAFLLFQVLAHETVLNIVAS